MSLKTTLQAFGVLLLAAAALASVGPAEIPTETSATLRRYVGRFLAWPWEAAVERPYALEEREVADPEQRARLEGLVAEARAGLRFLDPDPGQPGAWPRVAVLHLRGRPWEMGWVQGRVLRDEVRANVLDHMMPVVRALAWPRQLDRAWSNVAPFIREPFTEELAGLAAGSGVRLETLRQMHAVPEITESLCSGYAFDERVTEDGASYHVRVLDYATFFNVQTHPTIAIHRPLDPAGEPDGYAYANVTWAGFDWSVGGVNERALAVGEIGGGRPDALAGERPDGEPMGVLVRRVLNEAADVGEALRVLEAARRNLRYVYVISDPQEQVVVLSGPDLFRVHPAGATLESLGWGYEELPGFDGIAWHGAKTATHAERFRTRSRGLGLEDILQHNRAVALKRNLHAWVLRRDDCSARGCRELELWVANARGVAERAVDQPYVRLDLAAEFERP